MPRTRLLLLASLLLPSALRAADPDYPPDALAVVRLEPQPVWKHELMKSVRETVQAAGPQALAAFGKQVYPDPANVTAVSVIALPPKNPGPPPVAVRIDFAEPIDTAKLVRAYMPAPTMKGFAGVPVFTDRQLAVAFPDLKTALISTPDMLPAYLQHPKAATGPMPDILKPLAGKPFYAAVNVKALPLPPQAMDEIPEPIRPLAKADRVTLALDLDKTPTLRLRVGYADAKAADDAEGAVKAAAGMLKQMLAGVKGQTEAKLFEKQDAGPRPADEAAELLGAVVLLGAINRATALLDAPPVARDGTALTAAVELPAELAGFGPGGAAVAVGLLLPAVQKVREAAARAQSSNNLKQIALAFHSYHDVNNRFPEDVYSKDGKPLLSWRVHLLPYLEQDALYRQFKMDEPWDGEHNRKLLPLMPKVYMAPAARTLPADRTFYQGFVGKKGVGPRPVFVEGGARMTFAGIADGTSNTIMVAEAAEAVEWTKPADLPYTPGRLPRLGGHTAGGFNAALLDGSVRFFAAGLDPKILEAYITTNGGEVIPGGR